VHHDILFDRFAKRASPTAGHPATFAAAVIIILVWATSGPLFGFSNTWQLVINTSTTIITFLIVFLIQNTQNRDGAAMQLKRDELIRTRDSEELLYLLPWDATVDGREYFHSEVLRVCVHGPILE
jgi:low affinity Fe/Cu permease